MSDVAYQDEVVAVLKKTIQGADVREWVSVMVVDAMVLVSGAEPSVLWAPWHRQDLCHPCSVQGTVWGGDDESEGAGIECFR